MKRIRMVVVLLFIVGVADLWSQTTLGPILNDYRMPISKTDGGVYSSTGLASENSLLLVGRNSPTRYRCFYQWTLPDNLIPDGATISQVKLQFNISRLTGPQTVSFKFAPH